MARFRFTHRCTKDTPYYRKLMAAEPARGTLTDRSQVYAEICGGRAKVTEPRSPHGACGSGTCSQVGSDPGPVSGAGGAGLFLRRRPRRVRFRAWRDRS